MVTESLSDQRLKKRRQKTRLDALAQIKKSGGTAKMFSRFKNPPSAEQFVQMCLVARYGKGDVDDIFDPLSAGGEEFSHEYICDEWNEGLTLLKMAASGEVKTDDLTAGDPDSPYIGLTTSQGEPFCNLRFHLVADELLIPHLQDLHADLLKEIDPERYPGLYVEHDPADGPVLPAWGIRISAWPMAPRNPEGHKPRNWPHSDLKSNDHCTVYEIKVSTLERLITDEEQDLHGVRSHERHLSSGKIALVRPHERRNPSKLRPRGGNTKSFGQVVYRVFDADGELRYFGEGTQRRPDHVNSGCSHNFKINEHYFLRGPMRVEVIHKDLTKEEGLSIERLLLRRHRHLELWNSKDFEPENPS